MAPDDFNTLVALRAKQGECQALEVLKSSDQVRSIQPLLDFDPHGASPVTQLNRVEKAARLFRRLGRYVMVDASTVYSDPRYGHSGALGGLTDRLSGPADLLDMEYPVPFIPVVRSDSPETVVRHTRRLCDENGVGLAIRVRSGERLNISHLVELLDIELSRIDLIVDLQHVSGVRPEFVDAVLGFVHEFAEHGQVRSASVLAGSIPKTLDRTTVWSQPRYEEMIWKEVVAQGAKQVRFGDYGPVHPLTGPGFGSKHVSLKYTSADGWIYSRERVSDEATGPEDGRTQAVRLVCQNVVNDGSFAGASFSWGDRQIVDASDGRRAECGATSFPIALAMSHHLAYLADMPAAAA